MRTYLVVTSMLWLAQTAAAQPTDPFLVPCQSRDVFLSRLRTLLPEPQRAEEALARFAIQIEPDADGSWTLTVSQPGTPQAAPRTLRQASCPELAEAATLVVAAWADEAAAPTPPPAAAPPAAPPAPVDAAPAASDDMAEDARTPEKPGLQVGVSLNCDGALNLMPSASLGGSAAVWFLSTDRTTFTSLGASAWPTHRREASEISKYIDYDRPLWGLYLQQIRFLVDADPVHIGLFGGLALGSRLANDGQVQEFMVLLSAGAAVRWRLGDGPFALRFQVGAATSLTDRKTPALASIALDLALD